MKTKHNAADSSKPSKALQVPLWIACLLLGVLMFYLIGRVLDQRRDLTESWNDPNPVGLAGLEGLLSIQTNQPLPDLSPMVQVEKTLVARLGTDTPDGAAALNRLGNLYALQGDYAAAEAAYREVREILTAHLGATHPDVVLVNQSLLTLERLKTNSTPRAPEPPPPVETEPPQ